MTYTVKNQVRFNKFFTMAGCKPSNVDVPKFSIGERVSFTEVDSALVQGIVTGMFITADGLLDNCFEWSYRVLVDGLDTNDHIDVSEYALNSL